MNRSIRSCIFLAVTMCFVWSGSSWSQIRNDELLRSIHTLVLAEVTTNVTAALDSIEPLTSEGVGVIGSIHDYVWETTVAGEIGGRSIMISFMGFLTGVLEDRQDLTASFHGHGTWGDEPIVTTGTMALPVNRDVNDYDRMLGHQVVKIGHESRWIWINVSEVIVGGSIGFVAGSPTGLIGALAAGISTAGGALALSDKVEHHFDAVPSARVEEPALPQPPAPGEQIEPSENRVSVVVSPDGQFEVMNGARVEKRGNVDGRSVTGLITIR